MTTLNTFDRERAAMAAKDKAQRASDACCADFRAAAAIEGPGRAQALVDARSAMDHAKATLTLANRELDEARAAHKASLAALSKRGRAHERRNDR